MRMAIVAAKFTPDEANGLRRAMATFRNMSAPSAPSRKNSSMPHDRSAGMKKKFASACFEQIKGFGSYGFPESHAASFALLVYISAWIKKHHPAAFAAALLNSQPMGFYAPAEIVRCARDHNVKVLGPDAAFSHWDSTLERDEKGRLCLRLGLRQIDSLGEADGQTVMNESRFRLSRFRRFRPPHRTFQTRPGHPGRSRCLARLRSRPPRRSVGGAPVARRQAAAFVRPAFGT